MRDFKLPSSPSDDLENEVSFEVLDMLAQANIDFRRLPPEELQDLMVASEQWAARKLRNRRALVLA